MKKIILTIIAVGILSISAFAAEKNTTKQTITTSSDIKIQIIKDVDAKGAQELLKDKNTVVLDIRTADEYNSGYIKNAVNIDYYLPEFKSNIAKLDKDKTYFIYCRSGRRSGEAKAIFQELGFKKVYNLKSGIHEWIAGGYALITAK